MQLRRGTLWLALGLAMVLVSAGAVSGRLGAIAQAQTGVSVILDPADASLFPGERVTVDVVVGEGVRDLYGAQFRLAFEPTVLKVIDADDVADGVQVGVGDLLASDLVESAGPDFVVAQNEADESQGIITFAMVELSPARPADQGGVLAGVTFQALAVGQSGLSLLDVVLSDSAGQVIPSNPVGANVSVVAPATAVPPTGTPAPAPTETPSPLPTATVAATSTQVPAATATPEPVRAPTPTPLPPIAPSSGGLSGGAIAGIAAGIVAGLAAIAVGAVVLVRRRRQQAAS